MTRRMRKILCDRSGSAFPLTVAVTLVSIMLLCGVSEYVRLLIIAQGVRDAVQSAVIATVTENYDDVYHGVREGYSGGYQPSGGGFDESLDYGNIYGRLDSVLGLSRTAGYHVKHTGDGGTEFKVWGLSVDIRNLPLAEGMGARRFEADCSIYLEVPVSFGGRLLPPMRMEVRTVASYMPKF